MRRVFVSHFWAANVKKQEENTFSDFSFLRCYREVFPSLRVISLSLELKWESWMATTMATLAKSDNDTMRNFSFMNRNVSHHPQQWTFSFFAPLSTLSGELHSDNKPGNNKALRSYRHHRQQTNERSNEIYIKFNNRQLAQCYENWIKEDITTSVVAERRVKWTTLKNVWEFYLCFVFFVWRDSSSPLFVIVAE